METNIITDVARNTTLNSNINDKKRKCLTNTEFNAMVNWIDLLINDNTEFVLNKYGYLNEKALNEYPNLHENTVLSIVDARIQYYVRQRHHRVFNNTSNTNSPQHSSVVSQTSATTSPSQSPSHYQQRNKRSINSTNTMYDRYKELVADSSLKSPLITLANTLRMPAMLVAKIVLTDHIHEEKLKEQFVLQQYLKNDDSLNSSILIDSSGVFGGNNLPNDNSTAIKQEACADDSAATELDTSSNVDIQLSKQLNWLTKKLLSMQKVLPTGVLNNSADSSTNGNSYCTTINRSLSLSPHQMATSTWLIGTDPRLAYHVYKCSVIDGYYGSCVEFIKSCTGKRFEEFLKQSMTKMTTDTKSQTNRLDGKSMYITEKECRLRGLDMTPDMVLNEPIAISLSDTDIMTDKQEYTATSYVGGSDNGIRVLNWIESKAMFGGPEQMRTAMQRQLFPYWNRYGPGAVIYWFGHILDYSENDNDVSTNRPTIDSVSAASVNTPNKDDSKESTAFNFWSKYCLLMDGFPASNRVIMHNHRNNNRQNTKKKNSASVTMSV